MLQVKPGMVKSYTLYSHPEGSYVVSLCTSLNGLAVVCGHLDGSIYRFTFPQVRAHPCHARVRVCVWVCGWVWLDVCMGGGGDVGVQVCVLRVGVSGVWV